MCERQPHNGDGSGWATDSTAQVHPGMPDRWREGRRKREAEGERERRDLAGGAEARRRELEGVCRDCQRMERGKEERRRAEGRMKEREGHNRERGGEPRVEGKLEQEIEISRYDRSGIDSRGQTQRGEGE